MIKKSLAAAGIALLAVFSAPLAANADDYVPVAPESAIAFSDETPAPGETVRVTIEDGTFIGGESVSVTVDTEGDDVATLSFLKAATTTENYTATPDGGLVFNIGIPENASGTYNITALGLTSGVLVADSIVITPADAGAAPSMPVTGAEIPVAAIWIAGGAVVLGGVLLLVMGIRRRAAQH